MIKGLFTVKRLLLFILLMFIGAGWYVSQNIHPISVKVLNKLLAPYDIQVINLDSQFVSINQLQIPRLILQIEDSYLAIQDFELNLTDTLAIVQKQQLDPSDIIKITSQSVYIDLGASFFKRQRQQKTESSAAWQLVFNHIPNIDLGEVLINLPAIAATDAIAGHNAAKTTPVSFRHSLKMDKLTLNSQGELNTLWRFDNNVLFNLQAQLKPKAISLTSTLNLGQSQQGLYAFSSYLTAALHTLSLQDKEQIQNSIIVEIEQQLAQALSPLKQQQINITGEWHTTTHFDFANREIASSNHFTSLNISSALYPSLNFALQDEFNIELAIKDQLMPVTISDNSTEQTTHMAYGAKIEFAPFNQQLTFNPEQLKQLLKQFSPPLHANQYAELLKGLLLPNNEDNLAQVTLSASLTEASSLWLPLNNPPHPKVTDLSQTWPMTFSTPKVDAYISGTIFKNQFSLSKLQLNSLGEMHFSMKSELSLEQPSNIVSLMLPLQAEPFSLRLPIDELSLGKGVVKLAADYQRAWVNNGFEQVIMLQPSSMISLDKLQVTKKNHNAADLQVQKIASDQAKIRLNHISKVKINQNSIDLNISPMQASFDKVTALLSSPAAKQQINAEQALISWQPPTTYSLSWDHASPLIDQLLTYSSRHSLNTQLGQLKVSKTPLKQHKQTLLNLDQLDINQQFSIQNGLIQSDDKWQFDTITASSQHYFQPKLLSLAGQWQLETDITTALPTITKNQKLPSGLNIEGMMKLNGSFSMSQRAGVNYFEMLIQPNIDKLKVDYIDQYIADTQINTECKFNWQQAMTEAMAFSQLNCPETLINIPNGRSGLIFEDVDIRANVALAIDPSKPVNNWLQKLTGLSHTDISMTLTGDVLGGQFLIPEFVFKLHDKSHGYLLLQGLSLEKLLAQQPQVGVYANGTFDGVLPAEFIDGKLSITGGHLAAREPGGVIEVANSEAIEQLKQTQPYLGLVFDALEHLNYQQLAGTLDMQPNGDALFNIAVKGKSRDIVRPIHLNYAHEENLIQLYRSSQIGNQLQSNIEKSVK
ncbi:YdbH domain-containing protein [Shewanella subflava]|uniref:YdbH domain-containing protein n=1 Tax=Shewanella subflava TaxID=2986476 RepID=A0ABT3I7Y3_9GAMM|nr:YdbH domain-containing protein [Shewanella subflava]MCW3171968.1 YdbH domain-containing protein [Shewanella subflava]